MPLSFSPVKENIPSSKILLYSDWGEQCILSTPTLDGSDSSPSRPSHFTLRVSVPVIH